MVIVRPLVRSIEQANVDQKFKSRQEAGKAILSRGENFRLVAWRALFWKT